jgi:hypothetical protein
MSYVTQHICRNLYIPLATEIYDYFEKPPKSEANSMPQEKVKAVNRIHNYM